MIAVRDNSSAVESLENNCRNTNVEKIHRINRFRCWMEALFGQLVPFFGRGEKNSFNATERFFGNVSFVWNQTNLGPTWLLWIQNRNPPYWWKTILLYECWCTGWSIEVWQTEWHSIKSTAKRSMKMHWTYWMVFADNQCVGGWISKLMASMVKWS